MKTTPEALKGLYIALGGNEKDAADFNTSVEVLNAIDVLIGGSGGAQTNPEAIANITANADNITITVE